MLSNSTEENMAGTHRERLVGIVVGDEDGEVKGNGVSVSYNGYQLFRVVLKGRMWLDHERGCGRQFWWRE